MLSQSLTAASQLHNPNFKGVEFDTFLNEAGYNRFNMTPRKWIDATNAIGIISKSGRNGGTYAHKDSANLRGADLYGANLGGANLGGADLRYVPINCPSDGAFVGWKKVQDKLIKLLIPEDAKRCSAATYKCRCDKAQVLVITSLDEKSSFDSVINVAYTPNIEYKVGEMVYPDKFDEDRWNECSNGIHFFINKQDAINY